MAKATPKKSPTKTEIFTNVAEATGLSKKEVAAVFDAIAAEISKAVAKKGPGAFNFPGLFKIYRHTKPARKARKDVLNPLTGQRQDYPAKPAEDVIKVRPLKALKDLA